LHGPSTNVDVQVILLARMQPHALIGCGEFIKELRASPMITLYDHLSKFNGPMNGVKILQWLLGRSERGGVATPK